MAAIYSNFQQGTLSSGITNATTTLSSTAFASLPVVASPDVIYIVLDPGQSAGAAEVVTVTAHTASNTSVTVTRGSQSTTARSHNSGTTWSHAWTKADADLLPHRVLTTKGDILVGTGSNEIVRLAIGSNNQVLTADSAQTSGIKWAAAATSVSTLTDVTLTSLTTGQYLRYNGTAWVNTTDGSTFTALNASNLGSGTVPSARLTAGSTTVSGILQLTDSVASTSTTTAATPNSVKTAYDAALLKAGGTMTGTLTLRAGTATAGTAPLYMTSGTSLTTAAAGALEFDGTNMYFTPSTTRYTVVLGIGGTATARTITLSTAAPTGGSSGDIWLRHAA